MAIFYKDFKPKSQFVSEMFLQNAYEKEKMKRGNGNDGGGQGKNSSDEI